MNPPLPPEIRVEPGRQGIRYLLPPRETGPLKFVAVFFIGFGCLFGGFALFWILGVLGVVLPGTPGPANVAFALFGLPFLAAGLGIVGLGFFALCGRCEIEVQAGELLARERGGPFRWTRRIPLKDIRRFTLAADAVRVNDQPVKSGPMSDVGVLSAEVGAGKPRLVVLGYPRAWVEALAARLNADIVELTGAAPLPTTVTQLDPATGRGIASGDRFDPPAKTSITISQMAGGIVAVVPPQGARGTRGLLAFALIWLVFVSLVGTVFAIAPESTKRRRNQSKAIPAVVIGAFGLIGVGMLTAAVNQMRRKASLRASRDELIILQQSLFGTKTFKRSSGQLAAIRVGDSGIVVNNVPLEELQVHGTDGKKHGFFTNLTNDELHWLATHLRHATGVGEAPGESFEPPKLA
ncbi:MAG: hypothetical protein FD161_3897 [Limisphaerales bacterium]|nr:MAG: hypothetical protein FD161_3897 [Limisphaerales bacterium]KAG0507347.1 MAG: hypothetical protein E1N63_3494 [Limisphaerales bacterium]TXT51646.1 MAG: hypothetical protein FD140_1450 [Limisphaerales bacterium]